MSPRTLSLPDRAGLVRDLAREAGFDAVGIAVAVPVGEETEGRRLREWLAKGRQGSMAYMANRPERRADPREVLPGARSMICVAMNYGSEATEPAAGRPRGRYARGRDYKIFTRRLAALDGAIHARFRGFDRPYVTPARPGEALGERAGLAGAGSTRIF
jgi:epoxyqueuosine reductase